MNNAAELKLLCANYTVKKINIFCAVALIAFIEPLMFNAPEFIAIHSFYRMMKFIIFILLGIHVLYERKGLSNFIWTRAILQVLIIFSTFMHNGQLVSSISNAASNLGYMLIAEYFFPKLREDFLRILRNVIFILVMIAAYVVVKYPGTGLVYYDGPQYFLGIDNRFVFFTTPMIFAAAVYSFTSYGGIDFMLIACLSISLFITLYTWAVGGMLGMLLIAAVILFLNRFRWFNAIKASTYFLTAQITSISVSLLRVQYLFADFIVNVLEKDVTLTGRTRIWDRVLQLIYKNPLIGLGMQDFTKFLNGIAHAHNEILQRTLQTGIIGLILYLCMYFQLISKINNIRNDRVRGLCCITLFTALFMAVADTVDTGIFYMIYTCMYHYSAIFENK